MFLVRYHLVSCLDDAFLQTKESFARYHLRVFSGSRVVHVAFLFQNSRVLGFWDCPSFPLFFYPASAERLHY